MHAYYMRHTPAYSMLRALCMQTGLGVRSEVESSPPSTPWADSEKQRTPKKAKRLQSDGEEDDKDEELDDEVVGSAKQRTRKTLRRLLIDEEEEEKEVGSAKQRTTKKAKRLLLGDESEEGAESDKEDDESDGEEDDNMGEEEEDEVCGAQIYEECGVFISGNPAHCCPSSLI